MSNTKTGITGANITLLILATLLLSLAALTGAVSAAGYLEFKGTAEKEYGLRLLAVSEDGTGLTGSLYLKLAPGTGNVFIQAEPVTKLDTRTSIRLAKEIACQSITAVSEKCDNHDFFFRLEANASLVGGPSAGAAAAALTIAALDDAPINKSVAVTGTINSGGLVGQVGGLTDKIEVASAAGLAKVLIPDGERYVKVANRSSRIDGGAITNKTVDLVEYGKSLGIQVVEISDMREVLMHLTGRNYTNEEKNLEIDKHYSNVMDKLAAEICNRSSELSSQAAVLNISAIQKNIQYYSATETGPDGLFKAGQGEGIAEKILEAAKNLTSEGFAQKEKGNHYSAASLCFGANVRYSYLAIIQSNISSTDALKQINSTTAKISAFEESVPSAKTLSDMQIRGTVKERLQEAKKLLERGTEALQKGNTIDGLYQFAFAKERFGSANAWSRFMTEYNPSAKTTENSLPMQAYSADENESLRDGCVTRLQEADEHIQYLDIYLPGLLKSDDELGPVYSYLRENDYPSCIYTASLVKAKANAMLSALSGNENLTKLVDKKIAAAKNSIVRQTEKGEFPIVSYSYYEYANSLKQTDPPSALLFAEYALELSNLDIYLKTTKSAHAIGTAVSTSHGETASKLSRPESQRLLVALVEGIAAGSLATLAILGAKKAFKRKKRMLIRAHRVKTR